MDTTMPDPRPTHFKESILFERFIVATDFSPASDKEQVFLLTRPVRGDE